MWRKNLLLLLDIYTVHLYFHQCMKMRSSTKLQVCNVNTIRRGQP